MKEDSKLPEDSINSPLAHISQAAPTAQVLRTLELGIISIVHYGLNTYEDTEWGYGNASPTLFNPPKLDAAQWMAAAKAGEIKRIVFVCKHHDGFCLWPSPLNKDYTIANSPWKNGQGDLVKEVRDAALAAGIEFGAYLSPWDRHQASYATPAYVDYYHAQWNELMTHYGPITEIWLDGANGGDGWYGGNPGKRKLPCTAWDYYQMPRLLATLHEHYPEAINFGGATAYSMMWPGNEKGFVPNEYLYGNETMYWPPECDTPLRHKWFWHKEDTPKSLKELVDCYFSSVGRGGILNLGLAPTTDGLLDEQDVARLAEFGAFVRSFNASNVAQGLPWQQSETAECTEYTLHLPAPTPFNTLDFREELSQGMRIRSWKLLADGAEVASGTIAGFRRIARFDTIAPRVVKLVVTCPVRCALAQWKKTVRKIALRNSPQR